MTAFERSEWIWPTAAPRPDEYAEFFEDIEFFGKVFEEGGTRFKPMQSADQYSIDISSTDQAQTNTPKSDPITLTTTQNQT